MRAPAEAGPRHDARSDDSPADPGDRPAG